MGEPSVAECRFYKPSTPSKNSFYVVHAQTLPSRGIQSHRRPFPPFLLEGWLPTLHYWFSVKPAGWPLQLAVLALSLTESVARNVRRVSDSRQRRCERQSVSSHRHGHGSDGFDGAAPQNPCHAMPIHQAMPSTPPSMADSQRRWWSARAFPFDRRLGECATTLVACLASSPREFQGAPSRHS